MYILEVNHGGGEIHRHFLLPGQTYTLGRKECRILLPAAEPSISRHHATIVVAPMPRYSVLDPAAQLEIRIEDVSKHGTFVDRERVGKDNTRFLYPEDRIRLGLRVTARIIPMVLVLGISPALTDGSLDLVLDSAVHIGALVVEDVIPTPLQYYEHHTNCVGFLYVAEDNFTMDETMMQALGYGYTLVTPSYIAHLVKCLEERDTLMPSEFPVPSSPSPASLGLRAVHYRRPAQTFFSVTEFLSIGRPIVATVFQNYTFVVLDQNLREAYKDVLQLFGGSIEALDVDGVAQWRSQHPQTGLYPLTTCVLVAEDDFRVLSEEVMERGGGHGDFNATHARPNIAGYLSFFKYGVSLIPEENVHLSLYRNDNKELNTKATACYLQRTSEEVLADAASAAGAPVPAPAAAPAAPASTNTPASASCKDSGLSNDTAVTAAPTTTTAASSATNASGHHSGGGAAARTSDSPLVSPRSGTATITHLVTLEARRSRENSCASAPSPSWAVSSDKVPSTASIVTMSTAPASLSYPPVTASCDNSRVSSTMAASATTPLLRGGEVNAAQLFLSVTTGGLSAAAAVASAADAAETPSQPSTEPKGAATETTARVEKSTAASPPALDAERLMSSHIAPSHLNTASSGSSTLAPDTNSVTVSITTTPTALAKATADTPEPPTTASPSTEGSNNNDKSSSKNHDASTPSATSTSTNPAPTTTTSNSVAAGSNAAASAVTSATRLTRPVGPRASHPFSLALRHRQNSNSSEDDDGEDTEGDSGTAAAINGADEEETSAATLQTRRADQFASRCASSSGRQLSLDTQPSPVILPLKSEEVVRPRSRTASGSRQTAYAAAVAALGLKSVSHSEERPPLAPTEEAGQHVITMEGARSRNSGSVELSNGQGMPPLPPPIGAPPTAMTSSSSATTTTTTTSAPQLQRAPGKTVSSSASNAFSAGGATATAAATASPPASEKVTPSGLAYASVRRGEQRLAGASVPTPRRSLVRVNPALAAAHRTERSASPLQQQSQLNARIRRFTTPERDVVVHSATQVSKSPPRQRIEAVRITNAAAAAERHASASRDPEACFSRYTDPEEASSTATGGGSMGDRRSVLRHESVSAVNRPPPAGSGPVTLRASSSFHRSDSAQLREMATPHRLVTSRVSSSVPRRRSKVYGSVQRQRSPEPGTEEANTTGAEAASSGAPANPGPLTAAAQRASIRRRRGSPAQGNGSSANSGSAAGAITSMPGQIPGLRGGSAAPVLGGTSNATAETYFRINEELSTHCQQFMRDFIDDFSSEAERVTRAVARQTYMDAASKATLESGVERILEFLQYVNCTEPDIPSMYSTANTRLACHQVRQKSQYVLTKIKMCYKNANCKVPSSLTRARAALSARNISPTQRRVNSAAAVRESVFGRRQSTT